MLLLLLHNEEEEEEGLASMLLHDLMFSVTIVPELFAAGSYFSQVERIIKKNLSFARAYTRVLRVLLIRRDDDIEIILLLCVCEYVGST